MTTQTNVRIDPDRLNALLGQAVVEFGATVNAALVVIGDRLGLFRALAEAGPLAPAELAGRTGTAERYVPRVAVRPGGQRLRRPRPGCPALRAQPRAGSGVR